MDEGVAILVWILLAIIWFNFGFSWFCVALLAGIFLSGSK